MSSPFKFLKAYDKKDKNIFFGRDKEIELLYNTAFTTNLMLVYGQTGTGKTSLIQCGLANRFRESDWFDLYIRRGDNIITSLWKEIYRHAETPVGVEESVTDAVYALYLDFLKPVYLIFDQFEELFILGTKQEQRSFFDITAHLLQSRVPVKIIFIMREEYIAWLYEFEKTVPRLFHNRLRIEAMLLSNIEEVIGKSAAAFNIQLEKPEETIKRIIENNKDKKGEIGLPYLQVYLDRLYRRAAKQAQPPGNGPGEPIKKVIFTKDLVEKVGKVSDVMASFLDVQTRRIQGALNTKYPYAPGRVVWEVLNQFATVEGTTLPISREKLLAKFTGREDVIEDCLEELKDARILHLSEEDNTYEVAHDALARRIDDKRSEEEKALLKIEKMVKDRSAAYKDTKTFLSKKELNYIDYYFESCEEKLKTVLEPKEREFIEKSKRKVAKRRAIITFGTIAIIIILLLFGFYTKIQLEKVRRNYNRAEANRHVIISEGIVNENPTTALRVAEKAWKLYKSQVVTKTIHNIYRENYFYITINDPVKEITYSAVSRDGRYILTADNDGNFRLWDRAKRGNNGNLIPVCLENYENTIRSIALSSGGDKFLTGDIKGNVQLWNVEEDKPYSRFNVSNTRINAMAFSPNDKLILIGTGDYVVRLKNLNGNDKGEYKRDSEKFSAKSVAFSPEGSQGLAGYEDGCITLFEVNLEEASISNKQKLPDSPHKESVGTAVFSHNGEYILTGSDDGTACLWDSKGVKINEFVRYGGEISKVAFSPDSKYLFIATKNIYVYLTELPENPFAVLKGHTGLIKALTYNPGNQRLITSSEDGAIREWHLNGGLFGVLKRDETVSATAFSPDFKYLFTGFEDGSFQLYNLETKNIITPGNKTEKIILAAVFLNNDEICTGSVDGTICWWSYDEKSLESYKSQRLEVNASALAISPNAKRILTCDASSKTAKLWTKNGEGKFQKPKEIEFPDHKDWLSAIAFSPDGEKILTGSWDKTAILWKLKGPNPEIVKDFKGHKGIVSSVAFSPDGTKILTGSEDKTARSWDLHGNTLQVFKVHNVGVTSSAFSSDGRYILTADENGNICIWHVKMPLKDFLKKGNFDQLSDDQKQEYRIED